MSFWAPQLKKYGLIMAWVFELVALVVIGFLLGRFLDEKLGTDAYLMMTGVLLGFVSGIYRFIVKAQRFLR